MSLEGYRFGFQNQEVDIEISGNGNNISFEFRKVDPRIGRMWSIDPLANNLVAYSPYILCLNNPMLFFDPTGKYPFPIHVRSFAPFETFGGGFEGDGDNRGYSTSLSASSRISQKFTVDATKGKKPGLKTWCAPSSHPILGDATEIPKGKISNFKTSKGSKGEKVVSFTASYSGANPLVPASPDIDVSTRFTIIENEKMGYLKISVTQVGDRFPAAETFITDKKGNSLFIGVSPYEGDPFISLPGDNKRLMMTSNLTITMDENGVFTGVKQGEKKYTLEEWNNFQSSKPLDIKESSGVKFGGGSFSGGGSGGNW